MTNESALMVDTAVLNVETVSKTFPGQVALDHASIIVKSGVGYAKKASGIGVDKYTLQARRPATGTSLSVARLAELTCCRR